MTQGIFQHKPLISKEQEISREQCYQMKNSIYRRGSKIPLLFCNGNISKWWFLWSFVIFSQGEDLNYEDWKRNLDIVLKSIVYEYVLIDPCPKIREESTEEECKATQEWKGINCRVRYCMLASMSDALLVVHEDIATMHELDMTLKEKYGA
ncbi:hypothetical protein M9H77_23795 [Catharanthus roseus]|uniref:Uncharacterized protein n=1 Tax=Catharanthus roseus TaxID=4058 RepID=A0ACC0AWU6_CATRO|nr:hypothetical protein M9H77_23795 [Catharanthus roseus]